MRHTLLRHPWTSSSFSSFWAPRSLRTSPRSSPQPLHTNYCHLSTLLRSPFSSFSFSWLAPLRTILLLRTREFSSTSFSFWTPSPPTSPSSTRNSRRLEHPGLPRVASWCRIPRSATLASLQYAQGGHAISSVPFHAYLGVHVFQPPSSSCSSGGVCPWHWTAESRRPGSEVPQTSLELRGFPGTLCMWHPQKSYHLDCPWKSYSAEPWGMGQNRPQPGSSPPDRLRIDVHGIP
mmetsp:Transcript_65307/g.155923  ORF Transcript_65307/g.155923 Transcript_65307/m.155923 type:complete len:234 (-) Transcript_65307:269-970(-)